MTNKVLQACRRYGVFALLAGLALTACNRNTGPVPAEKHPDSAYILRVKLAPDAATESPRRGFLFFGARPEAGPPIYVNRYPEPRFPGTFYLTEENRMRQGVQAPGPLHLFARFDTDGNASTVSPGDWVAESTQTVLPGNREVRLTLTPVQQPAQAQAEQGELVRVRIEGDAVPTGAVTYVLLRAREGRIPLAAVKAQPASFPAVITVSNAHLLSGPLPALETLQVIVKVDQDGQPQTTAAGDLYGVAPAAPNVTIQLRPDERTDMATP